jgi:nucleoside triphosphate pyrophosphatase
LILASGSPRRKAILEQLGVRFTVEVSGVEELTEGEPRAVVVENALRKARALARPGEQVLGADTEVVLDGELLGKPPGPAEAEALLRRLSGREHEVMTGIALCADGEERTDLQVTRVRFRVLEQADLDWYVESGEWSGAAGGYAIQGKGAALVESIEGDYFNVVGLPVAALLRLVPGLLRR